MTEEAAFVSAEAVRAISDSRSEPSFLFDRRLKAWSLFNSQPLPGRDDPLWRRVDLTGLDLNQALSNAGRGCMELSGPGGTPGLFFGPVAQAVRERLGLLENSWASTVYPAGEAGAATRKGGKFHAMNQAFFDSGYLLHAGPGMRLGEPVCAHFALAAKAGALPHNLVVLEEGAELTLAESFSSHEGAGGFACAQTEMLLGPGARLNFLAGQYLGAEAVFIAARRARLSRGARIVFAGAHLGGRWSKEFIEVELAAPGAEALILGLYYGAGPQQFHLDTWQHHQASGCKSNLLYKGVLDDQSRGVYQGMIRLERGAQQTDAYQQNRALLLADTARADSLPGL